MFSNCAMWTIDRCNWGGEGLPETQDFICIAYNSFLSQMTRITGSLQAISEYENGKYFNIIFQYNWTMVQWHTYIFAFILQQFNFALKMPSILHDAPVKAQGKFAWLWVCLQSLIRHSLDKKQSVVLYGSGSLPENLLYSNMKTVFPLFSSWCHWHIHTKRHFIFWGN